jgi:chemotaxis protein methyltransferase CheR
MTAHPTSAETGLDETGFRAIAAILRARAGITLPDTKRHLVFSRLARRLRALDLPDFATYVALVGGPEGEAETAQMISALTTNVTAFFREPHHFETLRNRVLPPLVERARTGGRVRLWSAGCSSGEEALSIAMVLLDLCPEAAGLDIRILASDIDTAILARAKAGRFDSESTAALDPVLRGRWFERDGSEDLVGRELAAPIRFRYLNLAAEWPVKGPFDAIFCRNVTIYFDREVQDRVWEGFARHLAPAGTLFIGHSERITGPAATHLAASGITTYTRRS